MNLRDYAATVAAAAKAEASGADMAPHVRAVSVAHAAWMRSAIKDEPRPDVGRWAAIQAAWKRGWNACDRLVMEEETRQRDKRPAPNAVRIAGVKDAFRELSGLMTDGEKSIHE